MGRKNRLYFCPLFAVRHLYTVQPKTSLLVVAGVFGYAVNNKINNPLIPLEEFFCTTLPRGIHRALFYWFNDL
jgi:hypothetical protein